MDRTSVIHRGRKFLYFSGCDYFRLASHPQVRRALHSGLDQFGLNVAASRRTTGNHVLYQQLELDLARFFRRTSAVVVPNGYLSNLIAAQAVAGEFTHALIDERSHGSLRDAARFLDCPVIPFAHRDPAAAASLARRCGKSTRLILLTDGLFSHSGEVAPLEMYLRRLPPGLTLLVDDAHGAGVLSRHGRGTTEDLDVADGRIILTITLSKAFGVSGGAVLGSRALRSKILQRSGAFVGSTPPPLPCVAAVLVALKVLRSNPELRRRLRRNQAHVRDALAKAGIQLAEVPGPILPIVPRSRRAALELSRALRKAGIFPPLVQYPGGQDTAYFRFVFSSEHTPTQLDRLIQVLIPWLQS